MIRKLDIDADAAAIAAIYNHYIANTVVTFEQTAVDAAEMQQRMREILAAKLPWLIVENHGVLVGYAYASPWKGRCSYRYSVESTIYLDPAATGKGLGVTVYGALLAQLRELKLHTAIGGIAQPNPASVALHEKLGFRKVAQFEQVGWKFDRWVDVGYWQCML